MISNIHSRKLPISAEKAGILIDLLSSDRDKLWPRQNWPPMKLDRPLAVGATGGHGPIRYFVSGYEQGQSISFTFVAPKGFDGTHAFKLTSNAPMSCTLTHSIEMNTTGLACLSWPLIFGPMHDALIEDSLTLAEQFADVEKPSKRPWSLWVQCLRLLFRKISRRRPT
jgi:hypothetical protein